MSEAALFFSLVEPKVQAFDEVIRNTFASQDAIIDELDKLETVLNKADGVKQADDVIAQYCSKLITARVQVSQLLGKLNVVKKRLEQIKAIAKKT